MYSKLSTAGDTVGNGAPIRVDSQRYCVAVATLTAVPILHRTATVVVVVALATGVVALAAVRAHGIVVALAFGSGLGDAVRQHKGFQTPLQNLVASGNSP